MSLNHGILGFLSYGEMSGYDLAKAFDSSVKLFWHAKHSQIYKTLNSLEKDGLITYRLVLQEDRPNKKLYSLTPKGKTELFSWLNTIDGDYGSDKNPFLMKLFFSGCLSPQKNIERLEAFKRDNEAFLAVMQSGVPRSIDEYSSGVDDCSPIFWQMTAEFGKMYAKTCVDWANLCIEKLHNLPDTKKEEDK